MAVAAGAGLEAELALALELAAVADAISLARFGAADLVVDTKPDRTPVTEADRSVEEALRARLEAARPSHGVVGEEFGASSGASAGASSGASGGGAAWCWVIDPIDGTQNYLRGVPVWGTLIALAHEGRPVLGVVSAPALGRRWWAARGLGAFAGGRRIRVSAVRRVEDAFLSFGDVAGFAALGAEEGFEGLVRRCWRTRSFGDFWSHMLVAEGAVDVAVEPEASLWDLAALQVIVEEAGGRFTDFAGAARPDGGSAVSTNGLLHGDVLAALGT